MNARAMASPLDDGATAGTEGAFAAAERLQRFSGLRRFLGVGGPGMLVAVGYIDPGNWATDLGGGSRFGYALLSMILIANLVAMTVQALCARLALATGKSLAELCRDCFPRPVVYGLWVCAEVAMVSTDLAELVGGAIALKLLFGLDLLPGVFIMSAVTMLILMFRPDDWRWLRSLVFGLLLVIAASFVVLLALAKPDWTRVAVGILPTPSLILDPAMLVLGVGILGATVMPHNLYLHTGLLASTGRGLPAEDVRQAIAHNVRNSHVSLVFALALNAAILIAAGAIFHHRGMTEIVDLTEAYTLLNPVLGSTIAATVFAVALLAAGQTSTITGTLAGQYVMEGFLRLRVSPLLRRLVTRLIVLVPILVYFSVVGENDTTHLLVLSQVVLSLQLPFAVVPLLYFVGSRRLMGRFALTGFKRIASWGLALLILGLNGALLFWSLS